MCGGEVKWFQSNTLTGAVILFQSNLKWEQCQDSNTGLSYIMYVGLKNSTYKHAISSHWRVAGLTGEKQMKSLLGHRRRTCAEDVCKEKRKVNLTFFALDFFLNLLLCCWCSGIMRQTVLRRKLEDLLYWNMIVKNNRLRIIEVWIWIRFPSNVTADISVVRETTCGLLRHL